VTYRLGPGHDGRGGTSIPRTFKVIAVTGWVVVSAVAYGVAEMKLWDALTSGVRPWIFLLVGVPYWAVTAVVIVLRYPEDRRLSK
jgi:hypothetical protein